MNAHRYLTDLLTFVTMAGMSLASVLVLASPAQLATQQAAITVLPTVVVVGKRSQPHQLPTVWVVGKRQTAEQGLVAAHCPDSSTALC